jgi:hypothetical protein
VKLDIMFGFEPKVCRFESCRGHKKTMKKLFLGISLVCLLLSIFVPFFANAACPTGGLVTCSGTVDCPCTWGKIAEMAAGILKFIIWKIAIPLAVLALTVGGIILLTSAGNPGRATLGKQIIIGAIVGLFLALCSVLIVNFVLNAIGAGSYKVELPGNPTP